MIFKGFLLRVLVLVLLIALSGFLMVWSFTKEGLVMARFTFTLSWLLCVFMLVNYVNKTNRIIKTFIESLRYLDEVRIQKGKGKSFEDLDRIYNEIIGVIRKVEVEREADRQYFRNIIDHAGVGLISYSESGEIEIMNKAFRKLLGIKPVSTIIELKPVSENLPDMLLKAKPGHRALFRINVENETAGLSFKIAEFRLQGKKVRVASVQNIQHELEEEELDAWQKLIRVLTHEIMNSVTPVNSLTNTIIRMFEENGMPKPVRELDEVTLTNALEGLHSIEKRNKGLIGFVQSYRSLTRIQKPTFALFSLDELFNRILSLVRNHLEERNIMLSVNLHGGQLTLNADEKLVEQVLINLINNAVDATGENPHPIINIAAKKDSEELSIEVQDNGGGISAEVLNSIFIPFFTTKKDGSGIGLSLSRQIMRIHGGSISVRSHPGETIFSLRFPL